MLLPFLYKLEMQETATIFRNDPLYEQKKRTGAPKV